MVITPSPNEVVKGAGISISAMSAAAAISRYVFPCLGYHSVDHLDHVSFQSVKAATGNPVAALRTE